MVLPYGRPETRHAVKGDKIRITFQPFQNPAETVAGTTAEDLDGGLSEPAGMPSLKRGPTPDLGSDKGSMGVGEVIAYIKRVSL
jgi:hypothetical protein